jgi:predicted DNA-binding transcriptional regulator AlpA
MEKRLLSIEELSEYLGIAAQSIRNRLCSGTFPIPAKKVCGRVKFDIRDVEKYLDRLKPYNQLQGSTEKGIVIPSLEIS